MGDMNKRLIMDCVNKLDGLNNDNWTDIITRYGLTMEESQLEHCAKGMNLALKELEGNSIQVEEDEKVLKIREEMALLRDLRTDVNAKLRNLSRIEDFARLLKIENDKDRTFVNKDAVEFLEEDTIANLIISDLHYDGTNVPIDNFNKVIDTTISKVKLHNIKVLNVLFAGDLINNELKTVVRLENRERVSEQIINVSKLMSQGLVKLAENIECVNYAIVTGNHERSMEDYKKASIVDTYLPLIEILVKNNILLENNENINLKHLDNFVKNNEIDDRFCVLNINGKNHVLTHGYEIKNIEKNAVPQLEGYLGIKIDYLYLGHFHNMKNFTHYNSRVLVNGCCGSHGDYAKSKLYDSQRIQKLAILSNGDIECEYNIAL